MNCPRFCENTDRATCFGDFVVPEVDTSGYYTFVWYWIFNPGSPYISCYEAFVTPASNDNNGGNGGTETEEKKFAESKGNSEIALGYITQAPLCITYNDQYDPNSLDDWVMGRLMAAMGDDDEFEIIS